MNKEFSFFAALMVIPLGSLHAVEHTVGPGGFKTIAEGVAALKPGDTLTIMSEKRCKKKMPGIIYTRG